MHINFLFVFWPLFYHHAKSIKFHLPLIWLVQMMLFCFLIFFSRNHEDYYLKFEITRKYGIYGLVFNGFSGCCSWNSVAILIVTLGGFCRTIFLIFSWIIIRICTIHCRVHDSYDLYYILFEETFLLGNISNSGNISHVIPY